MDGLIVRSICSVLLLYTDEKRKFLPLFFFCSCIFFIMKLLKKMSGFRDRQRHVYRSVCRCDTMHEQTINLNFKNNNNTNNTASNMKSSSSSSSNIIVSYNNSKFEQQRPPLPIPLHVPKLDHAS